jgi:transcriptional regulator with XRE-family HTH domain
MTRKDQLRFARALGRQARKLRIAAGLKRKDAEAVGIHPSNLDKFEKGKRVHLVTMIPRVAKFLGIHQGTLLDFPFDYKADAVISRTPAKK